MTLFNIFIGISVAVIVLVIYSALVISTRQEQTAQRVRDENRFERAPYSRRTADSFAFETSEELVDVDEFEESEDTYF